MQDDDMESRLYWLRVFSGTVQFYLSIILSSRQPALVWYILTIFLPLRHSLASIPWQVHRHSIKSFHLEFMHRLSIRSWDEPDIIFTGFDGYPAHVLGFLNFKKHEVFRFVIPKTYLVIILYGIAGYPVQLDIQPSVEFFIRPFSGYELRYPAKPDNRFNPNQKPRASKPNMYFFLKRKFFPLR